jgi:hypothetical protein
MSNTDTVLLTSTTFYESNATAFEALNELLNETKNKVDVLNQWYDGFTKNSIDAYQKQHTRFAQFEAVMNNMMHPDEQDVEDIVDITKEQEQLGVVSSDVQLAGATELGTYVQTKESLEKLIPLMNDMLAHQYGVNATPEDAQSIAQMIGKGLEGQANALSQNGYSFSEAQEKILKSGNENERVTELVKIIAQSVGGINGALAATSEGKAKQAEMKSESFGSNDLIQAVQPHYTQETTQLNRSFEDTLPNVGYQQLGNGLSEPFSNTNPQVFSDSRNTGNFSEIYDALLKQIGQSTKVIEPLMTNASEKTMEAGQGHTAQTLSLNNSDTPSDSDEQGWSVPKSDIAQIEQVPENMNLGVTDTTTGGGAQGGGFNFSVENFIGQGTNQASSGTNNPASADLMTILSDTLQKVVNDTNYAA